MRVLCILRIIGDVEHNYDWQYRGPHKKRTTRLNAELHLSFQQVDGPALAMSGCSVNRVNVCACDERFGFTIIARRPRYRHQ